MPSNLNSSVILCLQCQTFCYNFKGVHIINTKGTYCFLLLCASHFPNTFPCAWVHAHTLSHTSTQRWPPYLVYVNNDLGIIKSTTGISFKCLCQEDNVSQYEDGISLIVSSQWQMWKVWMCQSQNSLKSSSLCTSHVSCFHQGSREIWEISLCMKAHYLPLPQWWCVSVVLWEAQYYRRLLGHQHML